MKLGLLIGRLINPIILGLIFFFIFTPISMITKIFKRDELKLRNKLQKTYWTSDKIISSDLNSFDRQF